MLGALVSGHRMRTRGVLTPGLDRFSRSTVLWQFGKALPHVTKKTGRYLYLNVLIMYDFIIK